MGDCDIFPQTLAADSKDFDRHIEACRKQKVEWEQELQAKAGCARETMHYRAFAGQLSPRDATKRLGNVEAKPSPDVTSSYSREMHNPSRTKPLPPLPLQQTTGFDQRSRATVNVSSPDQRANVAQDTSTPMEKQHRTSDDRLQNLPHLHRIPRKPVPSPQGRSSAAEPPSARAMGLPEHAELYFNDQVIRFQQYPGSPPETVRMSSYTADSSAQRLQVAQETLQQKQESPAWVMEMQFAAPPRIDSQVLGFSTHCTDFRDGLPPAMQPDDPPILTRIEPPPQLPPSDDKVGSSLFNNEDLRKYMTADKSGLQPFNGIMPVSTAIVKGDLDSFVSPEGL